ncbi:proline-rich receptor-like protein kinase PERK1 isoform X4 [Zingiber officinale]|uniref:proline-rich receptor-like protein kinase PERK1 isoform X4 n=1 Tax=Zingiber officinale TaxID=94328 RepID=UPI001C4D2AAD|nr:proline-rich receptor-like protein kinase PERK1 isoform X4 [Zingiber officinale]
MPDWLRYLGFTASLPFALAASFLSMIFTVVGLTIMFILWTLSLCTSCCSCCCQYEKMREVVKTLNTVHFYIIGWCTCDPSWSSKTVTEYNPNYQLHHQPPPTDFVIAIPRPPPPQLISSRNLLSPSSLTTTPGLSKRSFTYEELAISTNNFSMNNVLGEGGFSLVYKGTLTNGREVAIKRLKDTHRQPDLEFMKEFHLHGRNGSTLAWRHRFRISLDSAKGLEYLHEDCNPRVIHRDIKSANILLDHQFRAKIADFGIAKHVSDETTHISTVVKGTYGYLAPEYASTGKLTDKSDVYSYGVLLVELITGRKPLGLADWARPLLQKAMEDAIYDALIDPFLDNDYDPVEAGRMVACASACLCHAAALRPSMSQICRALEGCISFGDQKTIQSPLGSSSANTLFQSVLTPSTTNP